MRVDFDLWHESEDEIWEAVNSLPDRVKSWIFSRIANEANEFLYYVEESESPIEQLLGISLYYHSFIFERVHKGTDFVINPQHTEEINGKKYRVDFMIGVWVREQGKGYSFAVECDGHDFHEKTKEQARKDKSRDRAFQANGIPIFRFTGSEIYNDPDSCAREIRKAIETAISLKG